MAGSAKLVGLDEVLEKLEQELGEGTVRRKTNKAMQQTAKEIEPEFKEVISTYRDTGATVEAIAVSGVNRDNNIPRITLGFGKGDPTRWQLVHLNELGYAKNPNPRGFGVIRRFSAQLESEYPERLKVHLKDGFAGDF